MGNGCTKLPDDYEIQVKTGDVKGAGTDSNVYIILISESGIQSRAIHLDCKWRDDFEKGNVDSFKVGGISQLGSIGKIVLWRDSSGLNDDWFVQWVKVKNLHALHENLDCFPMNRWIFHDRRIVITKYDSILPQFDENQEQRALEILEKRRTYGLTRKKPGIPKQISKFPRDEHFSNDYKWDIQSSKYRLMAQSKITQLTTDSWESLEDFKNIYLGKFSVPEGTKYWKDDRNFGRQRLQGCNPNVIRLCKDIPPNFQVSPAMVRPFLEGLSLEEAIEINKIYIVNYKDVLAISCMDNKKLAVPMALFYVDKQGDLIPIAIQLFQKPAEDNPVFLPSDPEYTWMLAKMYFNNADCSYHQACTHLGFTHLVAESVCVGTHRQLSPSHPLFRLLAPHFLYIVAINTLALNKLIAPNGWIDNTMTCKANGIVEIIQKSWSKWRMDVQGWLPNDLASRGVDDHDALPYYPYRDDAILLHHVIWDYVREVLEGYYDTPQKLAKDWEIQEWGKMLVDECEGLGIKGVPGDGCFTDLEDLIQTVTSVIFICSVGHAASNFGQYDEYAFPPNYPAILRGHPPTDKTVLSAKDIVSQLPRKDTTLSIMVVTKILSDRGTNSLGNFEVQYMHDPIGITAIERFKTKLAEVGKIIDERNKHRQFPYPYLHPLEVPNSISI